MRPLALEFKKPKEPKYPKSGEKHILPPQKQYPPLKPHRRPNSRNNNRRGQR